MFETIISGKNYSNLVNGKWISKEEHIEIFSPFTGELLGTVPKMTKSDIDNVVKSARTAFSSWKDTPVYIRAELLYKAACLLDDHAEKLAEILMMEIGKDFKSCLSEVHRTSDFIRYSADIGKSITGETILGDSFPDSDKNKICITERVPLGVVLAISPFNYPVNLSASKIAPALIGGNCVILKPPTQGAISALHLIRVFEAAGIPAGVIQSVTGKSSEIGDYIVSSEGINFINFTGSSEVGKHISKITGMVPLMMELGGKDAAIVLEDADLELTASNIIAGAFSYSGQRCTAIKRVLVLDSVAEDLIDILIKKVQSLKCGLPSEDVTITPLIDTKSCDYVEELINDALSKGAVLLCGNKREGNLIYPTLLDKVTEDMRIAWEEPFGPVLPIIRVKDSLEAVKIANASEYGLQSSIFTTNINSAINVARMLEVGTVQINSKSERGPDHFPFSGVKSSGLGTQGIKYSIEAMTRIKSMVITIQ